MSGLSDSTQYYGRISCELDTEDFSFRTGSAAASPSINLQLRAPTGSVSAKLQYGATSALGSETTVSCSSTCSLVLSGQAVYWRVQWLDGGSSVLRQSAIQLAVGR